MKKLALIALAVVALQGCNKQAAEPMTTPADDLHDRLAATITEEKVLFGHHDDPVYGINWTWDEGRSDVLEMVGEYPAVMSWDLGAIESGSDKNIDGVPFERIRAEVRAQDARGGVNVFSWHCWDPITHYDSWHVSDTLVVSRMVNTPEGLEAYNKQLDYLAEFFLSLKRENGERIGVVFRPWHEHTGSWFWWGAGICSVADYCKLWHLMRANFDRHGVDNVLWAYSPDRSHSDEFYLERYPGDDYVDIMGADVYYLGEKEGYMRDARKTLEIACRQAAERGKLAAFTESGCETVYVTNWFTDQLLPVIDEYPVAYVVVWRNAYDRPNHYFAPFPGHPAEADFKLFYESPVTVFVK